MIIRNTLLLLLLFQYGILTAHCQPLPVGSDGVLYVTTDKTLYTPGETIWFAGYYIPSGTDSLPPDVMSVALLRQDTTAYSIRKNYLVTNDFCAGSLTLPQELSPGSYELVAALNIVNQQGKLLHDFRKRITVKSVQLPPFRLSFGIDTASERDTIHIAMQALAVDHTYINDKKASVTYHLAGEQPETKKLDVAGRASIAVPVSTIDPLLPAVLYTNTTVNNQSRSFNVKLPVQKQAPSDATWLVQNNKINDDKNVQLTITKPVADDTLAAAIVTVNPVRVTLAFQSINSSEVEKSSVIFVEKEKKMLLPLNEFPKGVYQLLLLNEKEEVIAQRPFFAHYSNSNKVGISPDKNNYGLRERVTVNLGITDAANNSVKGVFTVRCVEAGRLEKQNRQYLPAYYYTARLQKESDTAQLYFAKPLLHSRLLEQANALNNLFTTGTPNNIRKPVMQLSVKYAVDGSRVKAPVTLLVKQDKLFNFITTDSAGAIYPEAQQLAVEEGTSLSMKAGSNTKKGFTVDHSFYAIRIKDPMDTAMIYLQTPALPGGQEEVAMQTEDNMLLKNSYEGNVLAGVTVKSKRSSLYADAAHTNNCGDYVCESGYLNCEIHVGDKENTLPVEGQAYWYRPLTNFELPFKKIRYEGCMKDSLSVIYKGRLFKGMDENTLQDESAISYLSTLYWAPFLSVAGDTSIEFYTSNLPGTYKIIVEGVAENGDMVYEEKEIKVEEKK